MKFLRDTKLILNYQGDPSLILDQLVEHFFMEGRYLTLLETLETYSLTDTVKKEAIIILRLVHSSKC